MEMVLERGFEQMTNEEILSVDGGLFGVVWLTGALLGKIFAGAVTLGAAGATAYLATK